jgi:predicted O-methyltransferase YrrM
VLKTLLWFLQKPRFWGELAREVRYSVFGRGYYGRSEAARKCRTVALTPDELLLRWGFARETRFSVSNNELISRSANRALARGFSVSGGANLDVLYAAVVRSNARSVLETGVAAGWSTLAILSWLISQPEGKLISVDRPYPGTASNEYVGAVLPEAFAKSASWKLLILPDRVGIPRALRALGTVDLVHYDSDKTPEGRRFAYPLLYGALRPGGIFVSDDVGDNMAFWEFVDSNELDALIVDSGDKYVGLVEKPAGGPGKSGGSVPARSLKRDPQ